MLLLAGRGEGGSTRSLHQHQAVFGLLEVAVGTASPVGSARDVIPAFPTWWAQGAVNFFLVPLLTDGFRKQLQALLSRFLQL